MYVTFLVYKNPPFARSFFQKNLEHYSKMKLLLLCLILGLSQILASDLNEEKIKRYITKYILSKIRHNLNFRKHLINARIKLYKSMDYKPINVPLIANRFFCFYEDKNEEKSCFFTEELKEMIGMKRYKGI